jgi:Tfp pilus assembly protein PilO
LSVKREEGRIVGWLEIVVILVVAFFIGTAFFLSNKAEKITKQKAEEKRLLEEQNKGGKRK